MSTHEYSYKFRIYPNKEQETLIHKTFGCCRYVWNYYLAMRQEIYQQEGKTFGEYACSADLTQLKKSLTWLREVDSTALSNTLKDLDIAYKNFFRRVKHGENSGYPNFKSKRNHSQSYRAQCINNNIKVLDNAVQLPKLGCVECRVSKEVKGRILSATVSQNPAGKYFVSLCCTDVEIEPMPSTGAAVGIHIDPKTIAVTSDGAEYLNNQYYVKNQKKLAKLQRQLSRKTKGSNRYEKARIKVARLHEQIANQRSDTLHKWSTDLVRNYDLIVLEDIPLANIVEMAEDNETPKYILDSAWGEFRRQLEYKANWYGKKLVLVDTNASSGSDNSSCEGGNDLSAADKAVNVLNKGLRLSA